MHLRKIFKVIFSVSLFWVGVASLGDIYYRLPRFWTNTGLCPRGAFYRENITIDLLSDTMQMNLRLISTLPYTSITHIRIHWMLELLRFMQFSQAGIPEYDFDRMDIFLDNLMALRLKPVIEFMGKFSNLFNKNPTRNPVIWENLTYQIVKRYSGKI